jgi:peptide/nickel transport system substrate-binding protein
MGKMRRRDFLKLGVASGASLFAVRARAAVPTQATTPKRGGTLTIGQNKTLTDFNPLSPSAGRNLYSRAIYNTLTHHDAQLNPQPELAERWEVAPDGRSISLKLREGVKFHSGREFTSEDVKFTWEFGTTDPSVMNRMIFKTVASVETPSKYVVTLKFPTPNPAVFDILDLLPIIDKETYKDWAKVGIGTGPFKIDKYVPNDRVEMVAFKDYWEPGKPYLDKYVSLQIPDSPALAISLESGAVDGVHDLSYVDAARLRGANPKLVVEIAKPAWAVMDLAINCKVEPFTNKKVRQAMACAIDRERFAKTVMQGLVRPTTLMWLPHTWAYFPDLEGKNGYNLDRAKALLKEAGLEKGFETELITSSKRGTPYGALAEMLGADLKKIGVNAKIVDMDPAMYDNRLTTRREYQMASHAYGRVTHDPGTMVNAAIAWYSEKEGGWTRFDSEEYDRLRKEMQSTLDRERRKVTARKIQELALEECFTIPVCEWAMAWGYGSHVKGFAYDLVMQLSPSNIWLDK